MSDLKVNDLVEVLPVVKDTTDSTSYPFTGARLFVLGVIKSKEDYFALLNKTTIPYNERVYDFAVDCSEEKPGYVLSPFKPYREDGSIIVADIRPLPFFSRENLQFIS